MRRLQKSHKKLPMNKQDEPNFYNTEKYGALPQIEDVPIPQLTGKSRNDSISSKGLDIQCERFPVKLYVILAQERFRDIVRWMPHGRSWKVMKCEMFERVVMPLFFAYSNFQSFNRLVHAWRFRRVKTGPDRGSYYHEVRSQFTESDQIRSVALM